jgi:iron-sulfur cluster repair protein YtfE (RIC family)
MPDTKLRLSKATSLLKEDHQAVKALFDQYQRLAEPAWPEKLDLYNRIHEMLAVHAALEEEIFYPALEESRSRDAKAFVGQAFEEHKIVRTLLDELTGLSTGDSSFDAKMNVLAEHVKHHVRKEEGDLFPIFDKLPYGIREEISTRLRARKDELYPS